MPDQYPPPLQAQTDTSPRPASPSTRHADVDGLRVGAFALLILYHAGMPFSGWGWHIDDVVWPALKEGMLFVNRWRMALVFFVAGAGIMLALGHRGPGSFIRDRLVRLGLPLAVGMAVIVPPQVWAERAVDGAFTAGYLAFLPHAFDGVYPEGNLSWHHLWFLPYALVISIGLLPLFLALRTDAAANGLDRLARRIGPAGLLWALAVPAFLLNIVDHRLPANEHALLGDWRGLLTYGWVVVMGAVIYRAPGLADALARFRHGHLALGIGCFLLLRLIYWPHREIIDGDPLLHVLHSAVEVANAYGMILALAGYARRHASDLAGPRLSYAARAVFPFYILHQTITVLAAYALLGTGLPAAVKFLVLVLVTFGGCWLLYEGVIRRLPLVQPLFGLKPAPHRPTRRAPAAA